MDKYLKDTIVFLWIIIVAILAIGVIIWIFYKPPNKKKVHFSENLVSVFHIPTKEELDYI